MKCWHDNGIPCLEDCELIENCPDRERMIELKIDAIKEFTEWFDDEYKIYQKYYAGYCEVKLSTVTRRFEKQKGLVI